MTGCVSRIASFPSQATFDSSQTFGRRICEEISLVDAAGRMQVTGFVKALELLKDKVPTIELPSTRCVGGDQQVESD